MKKEYLIGGIRLLVHNDNFPLRENEYFARFQASEDCASFGEPIEYTFTPCDLMAYADTPILAYNGTYELRKTASGPLMICHWGANRLAYGLWMNELLEGNVVHCLFSPSMDEPRPPTMTRFFSTMGLHSKFLQRGAIIFHGSYVEVDGSAVIFAGQSGAGKSTQAALWENCGRGRIINGDRLLLRQVDGRWYAFGYPCCGSSNICLNVSLPVKAIVFLQKGSQSRVLPVTPAARIRGLLLGAQVFSWVDAETSMVYQLAQSICEQVPIVTLSATPDMQAVEALGRYLESI